MSISSRHSSQLALEALEGLGSILEAQAATPIHKDPVIAAYSRAMAEIIQRSHAVRDNFIDTFMQRTTTIDPWLENNLAFRAAHRWLLHPPEGIARGYPKGKEFTDPETYRRILPLILGADGNIHDNRFWSDILWRKVQSNKYRRYLILHLLRTIPELADMFEKSVSICDVGCSQNQGLKHVGLKLPFGDVNLDTNSSIDDYDSTQTLMVELINEGLPLAESIGTDFFPADDIENKEWVMACSLLPKELLLPGAREAYLHIENSRADNIDFIRSDFADTRDIEKYFGGRSFDLVTFFTILYQVSPEERRAMFDHAKKLSKRFILIADAAKKEGNTSEHPIDDLSFDPALFSEDYGYRVFLFDKELPGQGFVELWQMKSGRCESILFLDDHQLALNGIARLLRN